ncbi:MAG: VWA domain-containing protein [Solobacterium sp.]|nr:VWA domain-containing protein [Solobacterium sp.]
MTQLMNILESDIVSTNAPQLMVCILIDASYSMMDNRKIDMVNDGIRAFLRSGREDIYARDSLDVCFITFGDHGAEVIQDFANVQKVKFADIVPSGGTPLKTAVEFAVKKISDRREFWREIGISVFHPWLIIISDGKSDEDITEPAMVIQQMYRDHKLKGKCIGVGDGSETEDLKRLAPNGVVETMNAMEITNFFTMLSRSAAAMSMSAPDAEDDSYGIKI